MEGEGEIPADAVEREWYEIFEEREFENGSSVGTMRRRGVAEPFTTWAGILELLLVARLSTGQWIYKGGILTTAFFSKCC